MSLSDDEARQSADAFLWVIATSADANGVEMWIEFYDANRSDMLLIGKHLDSGLYAACKRYEAGDRSETTMRLVQYAMIVREQIKVHEAEEAAAKYRRENERRAATSNQVAPAPDIADRMTGVGLHGIALPDDATPDGTMLATRVAAPEPLMAFYIEHMRAHGWTLDLDYSRPKWSNDLPPHCFFSRPELPGRYVGILAGTRDDDSDTTRLSITEDED
jgi:hypothetical protein